MSGPEVVFRARDQALKAAWSRRQVRPGQEGSIEAVGALPAPRRFSARLPPGTAATVPTPAREALVATADVLLEGRWQVLGVERKDMAAPDWFLDPVTGRRAPQDPYCFRIDHRSEDETGNVKQVWELSRHHHLTLLAAAWFVTGDERYATTVDGQLRDWWRQSPNLSGVHWTSGIELGLRLISWVWIRRLLDGWPGAAGLFEENDDALCQIGWHQQYLATFRSRGSSANNHVIAEAAGQLTAACAFPWFAGSGTWRARAAGVLERELRRNTFASGLNRELAAEYHGFVAELGMLAAVDAADAGHPLGNATRGRLAGMVDAAAAIVDETVRPPRQGDGDHGRTLVTDGDDGGGSWRSVLAAGAALFGSQGWWPRVAPDVRSTLLAALAGTAAAPAVGPSGRIGGVESAPRMATRRSHFADAGLTLLRTEGGNEAEIWCRCDGGPHGYLAIAAHAHADALAVEVRHGGVDVLADPGTYCYHGEPAWRAYFRSTVGHNTLELGGRDQSRSGGPFLWLTHARGRVLDVSVAAGSEVVWWSAEHDGYRRLEPPAVHRRSVILDRGRRRLEITDIVQAGAALPCRMAFHLGPVVDVALDGPVATLTWPATQGPSADASAELHLPASLAWSAHRGEGDPVLGWYSPRFGVREPATTLLGTGESGPHQRLVTVLQFTR